MFTSNPYRRLKKFLSQIRALSPPSARLDIDLLKSQYTSIFPLCTASGVSNFHKLVSMVFEPHVHESVRIKLMVVLHYVMVRGEDYCEEFQKAKKGEFELGSERLEQKQKPLGGKNRENSSVKAANTSCRSNLADDLPSSYPSLSSYLHLHLTLPYLSYLLKLSINFEFYQTCRHNTTIPVSSPLQLILPISWKIINIIRSITSMKKALTNIGRYYLAGSEFILDLVEIVGNDVMDLYGELERLLVGKGEGHEEMGKGEAEGLMVMMEEVGELNEQLFVVFYNRYYFKLIKGMEPEKWLTFGEEEMEKVRSWYQTKFGKGKQKEKRKQNIEKEWKQQKTQKILGYQKDAIKEWKKGELSLPGTIKRIR